MSYACSFCRKTQDQVKRLIAGPEQVYICSECVELCTDIIAEEDAPEPKRGPHCSFCDRDLPRGHFVGIDEARICYRCIDRMYSLEHAAREGDWLTPAEPGDLSWEYLRLRLAPRDDETSVVEVLSIDPEGTAPSAVTIGMPLLEALQCLTDEGWEAYGWESGGPFFWEPSRRNIQLVTSQSRCTVRRRTPGVSQAQWYRYRTGISGRPRDAIASLVPVFQFLLTESDDLRAVHVRWSEQRAAIIIEADVHARSEEDAGDELGGVVSAALDRIARKVVAGPFKGIKELRVLETVPIREKPGLH